MDRIEEQREINRKKGRKNIIFSVCTLVVVLMICALAVIILSNTNKTQYQNDNAKVESLLRQEKTSYVTVQQGVKAYDDYRANPKMRTHLWVLVDPSTGGEYYFKNGNLTPRQTREGHIRINGNWNRQHEDTKNRDVVERRL